MKSNDLDHSSKNPSRDRVAWLLLAAGVVVYVATRLISIEKFPIYFFCDEAVHVVQFQELLRHKWYSIEFPHEFLPAFFRNGRMLNLSLSVYVQGLVSLVSGPSVVTVRTTSAVASLGGGLALALMLRRSFRIREWWSLLAFLAVIPCWFLHTRTGFETVLMASSYCWFLYFYLRYRENEPRWIFCAMIAGAATFYAYSPGEGVMFVTGLLLLASDLRYHWAQRKWALGGGAFGLLLFAPYVRFRVLHPAMMSSHLAELGSDWARDLPLGTKVMTSAKNYLAGLSPRFWFTVGGDDAVRHVVPNHAHLPIWLLPLALVGFVICLRHWRSAPHRLVLVAILATPFSSALVPPMVTRMLALVVPFVLLTTLGFDWFLSRLRGARVVTWVRAAAFGGLAVAGLGLLNGALTEGPTYSRDYALYGMQWGAQTLYRDILPKYLKSDPEANLILTHITFNSPENFPKFFGWMNERRVIFASLREISAGTVLPDAKDIVLFSAEEFDALREHPEIKAFTIRERVAWPDGRTGFYLGHVQLDPGFVADALAKNRSNIRPEWLRVAAGNITCSVKVHGSDRGPTASLFSANGGDFLSQPGEPINLEIAFDHPIDLARIDVGLKTEPGQRVTVWGLNHEKVCTASVESPKESVQAVPLPGSPIESIRIELSALPQVAAELQSIRLVELPH